MPVPVAQEWYYFCSTEIHIYSQWGKNTSRLQLYLEASEFYIAWLEILPAAHVPLHLRISFIIE